MSVHAETTSDIAATLRVCGVEVRAGVNEAVSVGWSAAEVATLLDHLGALH